MSLKQQQQQQQHSIQRASSCVLKDLQQSLQERMHVAQKATWDETMEGLENWSECGAVFLGLHTP